MPVLMLIVRVVGHGFCGLSCGGRGRLIKRPPWRDAERSTEYCVTHQIGCYPPHARAIVPAPNAENSPQSRIQIAFIGQYEQWNGQNSV